MTSEEFRNNPMFLRNQFETDGVFEMPKIRKDEISLENIALVGYDKLSDNKTDRIVHFFLDDYKFEVMWNDPEPRIERLKKYKAVLAPNYSLYTEMPLSLKIYNTFKSRWCGAYLQSKGITVIPTVAWGEPDTFWFCFDGIAKGSTVAVSTLGVRTEKSLFMQGYNEMLRRIHPEAVICYGEPFDEMKGNIIVIDYAETNNFNRKSYDLYTPYVKHFIRYIECEKGMGAAYKRESNSSVGQNQKIQIKRKEDFSQNVVDSYDKYTKHKWKGTYEGQSPGTRAGSKWNNNPPQLPQFDDAGKTITYREFDVNNKLPGKLRDAERFVRSSDGRVYYTPDHYSTFYEIIE